MFGANNQNACFNWFEPDDTVRDRGEALSIRQMIDAMIERHSVDRSRVYVVGLSAGGAMTAVMLAAYPERFAGGAIVAGVPYGCADTVTEALHCINPGIDQAPADWRRRVPDSTGADGRVSPVSIWQGDADTRVVPRNRQELVEQWTAVHGVSATPARSERSGRMTREFYIDGAGVTRVESVLVEGLRHASPFAPAAPVLRTGRRFRGRGRGVCRERDRAVLGLDRRQLTSIGRAEARGPESLEAFVPVVGAHAKIGAAPGGEGRRSFQEMSMAKEQLDTVYRIVDVVGDGAEKSWEDAGRNAVDTAAELLRDLRVAEVTKMDMKVENGKVTAFRTRVSLSFKYES